MEPDRPIFPPDAEAPQTDAPRKPKRSALGWIGRIVGGLLLLLVIAVGGLLLWLQTPTGAEKTLNYLADQFNPYEDATLDVESVRGNWLSNLSLYGLSLTREDGSSMAQIDSLELAYNLLAIPKGQLHLRSVLLSGAALDIREGADRSFDIALPFLPDTLAAADTSKGGLAIQVDRAEVRRTRAEVTFYTPPPSPDSTLTLSAVTLSAHDFFLGEELEFEVDTLDFAYALPRDQGTGQISAGATLADNLLALRSLRLTSGASDLFAEGTVRLPDVGGADANDGSEDANILRDLDFTVRAQPLAFQDVTLFLPNLDPSRSISVDADVRGDLDELVVDVDGRLSDGATFAVNGSIAPPDRGEQVAFVLGGSVRRFDLGFFGPPGSESPGRVSGTFQTDLEGTTLQTIGGTAQVRLFDTRVAGFDLDRTRLDVRADDGTFRLDLATGTRGATLATRGTVRPFADVPTYDLRGSFSDLDLAAFTEGQQSSDLNGTFTLDGSGFDVETIRADVGLNLAGARVNNYTIRSADLDLNVRGKRVSGLVAASLPEGSLRADLTADLRGDVPSYRVTDGVLTGLDVAALIGDTTNSRVNARFRLAGTGTNPRTMRLDVTARLDDTVWGTYVVQTADVTAALRRGRLDADVDADLEGGSFDLALSANPFADPLTYRINSGSFANVDLGRLTNNPNLTSDLTGTISATGTGTNPETLALDANITLTDSRLNGQQINAANGVIVARSGAFDYDLGLETPEGRTQLAGSLSLRGGEIAIELRESAFAGLNLGALLGLDFSTNLNGTGTLSIQGTDPQTMTVIADLKLTRSRVNRSIIPVGSLDATLRNGFADVSARLGLVQGVIAVNAEGRFFDERPTYRADGILSNVNVTQLAGLDSVDAALDLRFDVEGEGIDPETMTARLSVVGDTSRYESVDIYGIDARARIAGGIVTVDALQLQSNAADLAGEGTIAAFDTMGAVSDFELAAQLRSVDPIRPFLPDVPLSVESGQVNASITGPRGALLVEAQGSVASAVYDAYRAGGVSGQVAVVLGSDFGIQSATADADIGYFSMPTLILRRTDLEIDYDGQELVFDAQIEADDRRDARLAGVLDLRPEAQLIRLDSLNMRLDGERFRLLLPATINYSDGYRVSNFLLVSDDQQVAIDGVIDPRGEQNLVATFDGLRLDGFTDLIGYGSVGGTLDGFIDLTGPAFAPILSGALDLDLVSGGKDVGTLDFQINYDDLRLAADATFTHSDGSTLLLTGYAPIDLRLSTPEGDPDAPKGPEGVRLQAAAGPDAGGVDFEIVADSFSVGWITPFLPDRIVTDFDGKLTTPEQITVTGTFADPVLGGGATLSKGRIGLVATNLTYRDITATLDLEGNRINVRDLSMNSGGGTAEASGTLQFEKLSVGDLDLAVYANDFLAIDNEQFRFVADAALDVKGTTLAPTISGDATVISGDVFLDGGTQFEAIALTDEDILKVESTFGIRVETADTTTNKVIDRLTLDMDIALERDNWIRQESSPQIDIQFSGDIQAVKRPGSEFNLFGSIGIIPERSRIVQFGRKFQITEGTLDFNGLVLETNLNLNAEFIVYKPGTRERVAAITLGVRGRLNALNEQNAITLGSEPQMETADIVSYIATGRPASQSLAVGGGGSGGGLAAQGYGLAFGQIAGLVQGAAGNGLGLDVIEIEQDGTRGARLTAGKYLNRRFFASYSQPITLSSTNEESNSGASQQPTITIEYELSDWLLARLLYDRAIFRLNFQTETSF